MTTYIVCKYNKMNSIPFYIFETFKLLMYSLVWHSIDLIQKKWAAPIYASWRHRQTPINTYTDGSPHIMSCSVPRVYILFNFGDLSRSEALYICSHKNHVPKNDGAKVQKINQILSYLSFCVCVDSSKFSFSMFLTYLLTPKRVYIFR